ncbi:MAG: cell division protein SepF [Xenococcus sp. MO_188.B8]|nr:cell division protein SepF [Xenococcus sp. MO_188.B8]
MIETIKRIIGIEDDFSYDYDGDGYEEYSGQEEIPPRYSEPISEPQIQAPEPVVTNSHSNRKKSQGKQETTMPNKVVGMPGLNNGNAEVTVIEPQSFEEMPQVIAALRERKSVVLNLNMMNPEEAQRAVDFVAGGTYAMDGHQERVGESIFLFTPSCVKVSTLSGIIHEVDDLTDARINRSLSKNNDPWQEPRVMAQ